MSHLGPDFPSSAGGCQSGLWAVSGALPERVIKKKLHQSPSSDCLWVIRFQESLTVFLILFNIFLTWTTYPYYLDDTKM